eukprot:gene634-3944_t
MQLHLFCILSLFVALPTLAVASGSEDQIITQYIVEHTIGNDPFSLRGIIEMKTASKGLIRQQFDEDFLSRLYVAATEGKDYKIRLVSKSKSTDFQTVVEGFINSCDLYASGFTDSIILHVNNQGLANAVSVSTSVTCPGKLRQKKTMNPSTTVTLLRAENAPTPYTEMYIKKIKEQEAKASEPEQKSFFGNMWMFIIPLVIVQLLSAFFQSGKSDAAKK